MSIFAGKTLMITGGTGSFGNAVLKRFLRTDIAEIRIFSRDEKKQDDMRHEYQAKFPDIAHKIKFYIGDVRSLESVRSAMPGTDYIFHAAALKQVPSCEFFPVVSGHLPQPQTPLADRRRHPHQRKRQGPAHRRRNRRIQIPPQ